MTKLISIITPAFRSASTLEECLLSVKNQGDFIEHIVIDGGSSDGTIELLKKYENSYNLKWLSEPDKGITDAMNKGFNLAQGEIVAWLDADNYYQPGIISEVANIFVTNNSDIVYGNINFIDKYGQIKNVYSPPNNISLAVALQKNSGGIPAQPGTFFKRDLYQKVKGFDLSYKVAGDVEFWMKVLKTEPKLYYYNKIIGSYRLEESGASQSLKGVFKGLKEMLKIYKQYNQPLLGRLLLIKKYLGGYLKTLARNYYKK